MRQLRGNNSYEDVQSINVPGSNGDVTQLPFCQKYVRARTRALILNRQTLIIANAREGCRANDGSDTTSL